MGTVVQAYQQTLRIMETHVQVQQIVVGKLGRERYNVMEVVVQVYQWLFFVIISVHQIMDHVDLVIRQFVEMVL
jgi:hypothetical protein